MKDSPAFWKAFKSICIVQLILVAFEGMQSVAMLFYKNNPLLYIVYIIAYAIIFRFVYNGLSLLSYNYPNTPLQANQKRSFNLLFLANFLLIAFLFAQVVNTWWIARLLFTEDSRKNYSYFILAASLVMTWLIFILHLIFLYGMFRLRRTIHENTVSGWYEQFDQKS